MIFADKLIALRKKAGYSQEELAQQLNASLTADGFTATLPPCSVAALVVNQ